MKIRQKIVRGYKLVFRVKNIAYFLGTVLCKLSIEIDIAC